MLKFERRGHHYRMGPLNTWAQARGSLERAPVGQKDQHPARVVFDWIIYDGSN